MPSVKTVLSLGALAAVGLGGWLVYSRRNQLGAGFANWFTRSFTDPFDSWVQSWANPVSDTTNATRETTNEGTRNTGSFWQNVSDAFNPPSFSVENRTRPGPSQPANETATEPDTSPPAEVPETAPVPQTPYGDTVVGNTGPQQPGGSATFIPYTPIYIPANNPITSFVGPMQPAATTTEPEVDPPSQ